MGRVDVLTLRVWAGRGVSPSCLVAPFGFPSLDRADSSLEPCRHVRKAEAGHLVPLLDEGFLSPGRPPPGARI